MKRNWNREEDKFLLDEFFSKNEDATMKDFLFVTQMILEKKFKSKRSISSIKNRINKLTNQTLMKPWSKKEEEFIFNFVSSDTSNRPITVIIKELKIALEKEFSIKKSNGSIYNRWKKIKKEKNQ